MGHCVAWIPIIQVLLASSLSHQCPCWGGYKGVEGVGPSQQEKSPEVTGKQDVGNILDYTISVTGWGEEKLWDAGREAWTGHQGASWWSWCCDGQTGCPAPNASKGRQGSGNVVCLGDAPRKHKGGSRTGRQRREQGKYRVNYCAGHNHGAPLGNWVVKKLWESIDSHLHRLGIASRHSFLDTSLLSQAYSLGQRKFSGRHTESWGNLWVCGPRGYRWDPKSICQLQERRARGTPGWRASINKGRGEEWTLSYGTHGHCLETQPEDM